MRTACFQALPRGRVCGVVNGRRSRPLAGTGSTLPRTGAGDSDRVPGPLARPDNENTTAVALGRATLQVRPYVWGSGWAHAVPSLSVSPGVRGQLS